MKDKLKSRKLWATLLGVVLFFLAENLGLSIPESAVYVLVSYIGSQAAVDALKEFRRK